MKRICLVVATLLFANAAAVAQLNPIPLSGVQGDDIPTIVYDPAGAWWFEHPTDETGAAAVTTFELTAATDFFQGEVNWKVGLFDVYNPRKAFRLDPTGFTSLDPAAAIPGLPADEVSKMLTINGSFAGGGALNADLRVIPEPSSLVLLCMGGLTILRGRRIS